MSESAAPAAPSVERLVFFSDAAVAIALTLLILPLVDGVGDAAREGMDAFGYVVANTSPLLSFVLSFVIISAFWRSHHRLFSSVERETPGLFWLNMVWLLAIVFLPVATAMTGAMPSGRPQLVVYIGTMIVAALAQTMMETLLRRHPETWSTADGLPAPAVAAAWATVVLMVTALAIGLIWPGVGYWSLLALVAVRPVRVLLNRAGSDSSR